MYSQGDIEDAVASGALAAEQASSLRAYVAGRNNTPTADEEYYRAFRGFNDWYVFYTILLTLVTVGWLGALVPTGGGRMMGPMQGGPFLAPLFVAAASWGLAEIFTRRRRTALPSLFLPFTFGFGVLFALVFMVAPMLNSGPGSASIIGALCCAGAAGASYAYWLRFRQPISPMLIVGLGVLTIIALIGGVFATSQAGAEVLNIIVLLLGIATFAYAMWLDGGDPWRVTERNEIGLWMHGLAATLLVFPIIYFVGLYRGVSSIGGALAFILVFLLFAFAALAVNRKALLIAAVSPLIVALNILIPRGGASAYDNYGGYRAARGSFGPPNPLDALAGTVVTLLLVSLIMLALAIWWAPLRRAVSGILPASLRARAPVEDLRPNAPPPYGAPPPPSY